MDILNYGNRLQNYALQETINSFGFEVETIINSTKPKIENSACLLSRVCNLIKRILSKYIKRS